ncbi:Tn3 family transposase, partial [Aliarcobacter butzleri]
HQVKIRTDYLIDIFIQVMQSIKQSTLREHQTVYYEQKHNRTKNFEDLTQFLQEEIIPNILNLESILKNQFSNDEKIVVIENIISEIIKNQEFQKIKHTEFNTLNSEINYYDMLENNSSKIQIRVAKIIQNVDFDSINSNKAFISSIEHYRNLKGKINSNSPIDFLDINIQSLLFKSDNEKYFRISLYKILFFIEISEAIKSGKLNLLNSYRYRAFESYLMNIDKFKKEKDNLLQQYNLSSFSNCKETINYLKEDLNDSFKIVNEKIAKELNIYFHLKGENSFTVSTPKVEKNLSIDPLAKWLPKDKFIPLISIFEEINSYINFTKTFTHYSLARNRNNVKIESLFASIIGYGCNINLSRMAKISKGISEHDIEYASNWYLSNENLIEANDKIIAFTEQLDIVKLFKKDTNKNHTASDGQKFNISVDSLNAGYSFKYFGLGRGVSRYMFIDESHRLFYSTVINANEREAAYVIDGLMHNNAIQSDIHSTDTFGYSEVVFALTHLLGFSFAPRIKNFKDQQLYAFEAKKEYHKLGYKLLPIKQINIELIEDQWENILRFVLTIKERETTASQLLKRLTSYSRQHKLYQALREFGRIIKTKFLLEYIDNVSLRQQIEKQLNKIENANKFSKAIFFGNNGEYLYATKEEQDIASNSLRLIQNAIICWNYLYFSDKLAKETDENEKSLIIQSIKNGSIVHWQHINFYGEYDFTGIETNKREFEFNLEKIIQFKLEDN